MSIAYFKKRRRQPDRSMRHGQGQGVAAEQSDTPSDFTAHPVRIERLVARPDVQTIMASLPETHLAGAEYRIREIDAVSS
jgi:hypothetical protein